MKTIKTETNRTNNSPSTIAAPPSSPGQSKSSFFSGKNINNRCRDSNHDSYASDKLSCVRFSEVCRVVLIPTKEEYKALGLHLDLWWQKKHFYTFRQAYLLFKRDCLLEKQQEELTNTTTEKDASEKNASYAG